jgi:exopolysaccharide production protein ExoQ
MPPTLALVICIFFLLYLFWTDLKKSNGPSNALWIPLIWMFLAGSRYVSSWLNLDTPMMSAEAYSKGSPLDAAIFGLLIAAGVFVSFRRKVDWGQLLIQNKWIWLYFLYCGISTTWSDDSLISFKRLIKELGNVIMVMVILTEKRPYEAVGVILRRFAFLVLPLSVLFLKYYPDLGRAYQLDHMMATGIAHQKNGLGQICLISGIYFSWNFLLRRKEDFKLWGRDNINDFILLGMVAWLLHMSHSATSLACLVVAASLLFMARIKSIAQNPDRIIVLMMVVASIFLVSDAALDVKNVVIVLLGRSTSLTDRVPIWHTLSDMVTNPFIGTGYMSFWSGHRLEIIWGKIGTGIIQAHNGYLETYLNLGYIGVVLIGVIIVSGLLKVRKHLNLDYPSAMLRLCFIVSAALYNYTEASFCGINNIWLLLLLGNIEIRVQQTPERINSNKRHHQSG